MTTAATHQRSISRRTGSSAADLRTIPGVGPKMAAALGDLGIARVGDLKGKNPGQLYTRLCQLRGYPIDRCVLYVFRCAVYFASESKRKATLLKWWNWRDREYNQG